MFQQLKTVIVIAAILGFVVLGGVYCHSDRSSSETDSLLYLNHSDSAKYVGINTCKQCHSGIYESFIQTGMGQSFGLASRQKSAAKFSGHDVVYDKYRDFYYQPLWIDSAFYIKEYRLKGKDTTFSRMERVDYIIGSGQHTNSHMMQVNGYFYQMPLTFYTQKGKWDLPPGFEKGHNSRFSRKIELECMSCHNAYPSFVPGSVNKFNSVLQGIDCERCHGPGSIHVQQKQLGNLVDTATHIDYTIVNPKKLPYELQVDVCQRCHLQGNAVLKEGKSFFDFKPGMHLSDFMNVFMPKYTESNEFIMASHAERLKSSKCFISSTERNIQVNTKKYVNSKLSNNNVASLTCISCHDPHKSVKYTEDAQFNNACKSCHQAKNSYALPECKEKMATRKINKDNCWKCHMPKSGSIDIPHVRVTDHRIQIPINNAKKQAIKQFIGLKSINNPQVDAETMAEGYISYYEKFDQQRIYADSAAYYLGKSKLNTNRHLTNQIRLYYLTFKYPQLIALIATKTAADIPDAWTAYRIAEAYEQQQDLPKAYDYYKRASALMPFNLDFANKYATAAGILGNTAEAKSKFEFIVNENPKSVSALNNLGYLYLTENKANEAEKLYNAALALDPDDEATLMNKAGFYLYMQQPAKAKSILLEIIHKNPKNAQAKQILANL